MSKGHLQHYGVESRTLHALAEWAGTALGKWLIRGLVGTVAIVFGAFGGQFWRDVVVGPASAAEVQAVQVRLTTVETKLEGVAKSADVAALGAKVDALTSAVQNLAADVRADRASRR